MGYTRFALCSVSSFLTARSYDDVLAKYAKPVLDVSQDGPHNQIGPSEPK
jgi:hypothetical protein